MDKRISYGLIFPSFMLQTLTLWCKKAKKTLKQRSYHRRAIPDSPHA